MFHLVVDVSCFAMAIDCELQDIKHQVPSTLFATHSILFLNLLRVCGRCLYLLWRARDRTACVRGVFGVCAGERGPW